MLFDWREFVKRNPDKNKEPISIETHNLENDCELLEYKLSYKAHVDISYEDNLISVHDVDYISHLYEPNIHLHRLFFEECGHDKLYVQCGDVKSKEKLIRLW